MSNSETCIPVKLKLGPVESQALQRLYENSGQTDFNCFIINIVLDYIETYG